MLPYSSVCNVVHVNDAPAVRQKMEEIFFRGRMYAVIAASVTQGPLTCDILGECREAGYPLDVVELIHMLQIMDMAFDCYEEGFNSVSFHHRFNLREESLIRQFASENSRDKERI